MNRSPRSLVAVSSDLQREPLLEALLVDANDYDVVYMESLTSASARVRLTAPDPVIVLVDVDNAVECHLECHLTAMLKIECERLGIALVTCASRSPEKDFDAVVAMDVDISYRRAVMPMS
jgi:hypothetical protein